MSPRRFHRLLLAIMALGIVSCGQPQPPPQSTNKPANTTPPAAPDSATPVPVQADKPSEISEISEITPQPPDLDARYRRAIVGVWKQSNTGTRWLRIRPDGTGTMYIDPDWIAQTIIGDSLTMRIEWSIEDGRAMMNSISGKPETAFDAVTTLFGRERNQKIVELNEELFVLRDNEDGSLSKWTRVPDDADIPTPIAK